MARTNRNFNWIRFLERARVDYATSGPNVARGHLVVRCPFCGHADPSMHMSINLEGKYWRCWRNPSHSGRSKAKLVARLLNCSFSEAQRLVGEDIQIAPQNDQLSSISDQLRAIGVGGGAAKPKNLKLPKEFHSLREPTRWRRAFVDYLTDRGYRKGEIQWLAEAYDMQYASRGEFAWRLILPIYDRRGKLQTWTGRTISENVQPRYRTLSVSMGPALKPTSDMLLGLPLIWEAESKRVLVVCEGPFDALRLTASGWVMGVWATCLFGLQASEAQRDTLLALERRFDKVVLLLDTSAALQSLRIADQLAPLNVSIRGLPAEFGDPGEMPPGDAAEFCMALFD